MINPFFSIPESSVQDVSSMTNVIFGGFRFRKEHPNCTHYGKVNHIFAKCYKLHGYPPGLSGKYGNSSPDSGKFQRTASTDHGIGDSLSIDQWHQFIAFLTSKINHGSSTILESTTHASINSFSGIISSLCLYFFVSSSPISYHDWVIDTRATHHVCCSLKLFSSTIPVINSFVRLLTGESIQIKRIGSVLVSNSLVLHNVLFVPQFTFNLISVSALTLANSYSVTSCHLHV